MAPLTPIRSPYGKKKQKKKGPLGTSYRVREWFVRRRVGLPPTHLSCRWQRQKNLREILRVKARRRVSYLFFD